MDDVDGDRVLKILRILYKRYSNKESLINKKCDLKLKNKHLVIRGMMEGETGCKLEISSKTS